MPLCGSKSELNYKCMTTRVVIHFTCAVKCISLLIKLEGAMKIGGTGNSLRMSNICQNRLQKIGNKVLPHASFLYYGAFKDKDLLVISFLNGFEQQFFVLSEGL